MQPMDQLYGDRSAAVKDQFGNYWWIATHIEDLPKEEITRRMNALKK
jgi:PhnB protein